MFKKFYLNVDYSFDMKGNCKFKGNIVQSDNDFIEIEVSSNVLSLSRVWLGLIAHYEIKLPFNEMCKINFIDSTSKVLKIRCKKLMIIKKPIIINNEFRIIPGFPNFAINNSGKVMSMYKTRKILKEAMGPYGYPYVNIYDPDKNKWRSVCVHLLLARAFIKNDNPIEKIYVNHKDGIKNNYDLNILEWVSSRENIIHAFSSGLRSDNQQCMVRNCISGEIENFSSLSNAASYIGLKAHSPMVNKTVNSLIVPILFFNKFEIKFVNDESDWFYTTEERIKARYYNVGPYQAKNIETNTILETNTISEMALILSMSKAVIEKLIKSVMPKVNNNYIFRIKSNLPWPENYSIVFNTKIRTIKIINIVTGEEKIFNGSKKLRDYLGLDKKTLKDRLQSKKPYKDWLLEEINIQ